MSTCCQYVFAAMADGNLNEGLELAILHETIRYITNGATLKTTIGSFIAALAVLATAEAFACDFEIPTDVTVVDGIELGVQPGDDICLDTGFREYLELVNLAGTPEAPIVVKPQVSGFGFGTTVESVTRGESVLIHRSRDLRLTGNRPVADEPESYRTAIRINVPAGKTGIRVHDVEGDIEIDYIDFQEIGGLAIIAHARPICSDSQPDEDERTSLRMHHLEMDFPRVPMGEGHGIRVGDSEWDELSSACDDAVVEGFAYFDEVEVRDSMIRTPGEPLRITGANTRCLLSDNRFTSVESGILLETGAGCEIARNLFDTGTEGLRLIETGPVLVYNNYFDSGGIVVESSETNEAPHRILFNTFTGALRMLTTVGMTTQPHEFINNLGYLQVPDLSQDDFIQGDLDAWEIHHNIGTYQLHARQVEYLVWVPYKDADAAGAGVPIEDVPDDYLGNERPDPPTVGAAEAMFDAPDDMGCIDYCGDDYDPYDDQHTPDDSDGPTMPDPMDDGQSDDASPAMSDEGCGCSSHSSDATPALLLLMIPALLWRRRKTGGTDSNVHLGLDPKESGPDGPPARSA